MSDKKVFIGQAGESRFYSKQVKKRKKFIIEYEDGSTEEVNSGILYTIVEDEKGFKMEGKHCNTKEKRDLYVLGLSHIAIGMLENEKDLDELFNE